MRFCKDPITRTVRSEPSPMQHLQHWLLTLFIISLSGNAQAQSVQMLVASDGSSQRHQIENPWIGAYSMDAWVNPASVGAAASLDKASSSFTIASIEAADGSGPLVNWTLTDGKLQLAQRNGKRWVEVEAAGPLPINTWSHVAAVQDTTGALLLFVNGKPDQSSKGIGISHEPMGAIEIGSSATSVSSAKIKSVRLFAGPLSDEAVAGVVRTSTTSSPQTTSASPLPLRVPAPLSEETVDYDQNRLQVHATAEFPLAAGMLARMAVVPGRTGELPGLMAYSRGFGAERMYFPGMPLSTAPKNREPQRYQTGRFLPRITIYGTVCFEPLFPCRIGDKQGMVTAMKSPVSGLAELFFLRHSEKDPTGFEDPRTLPCGPALKPFGLAYEGYAMSYFGDIDQDGTPDLLLIRSESTGSYYPDFPKNFWTGEELPNSGPGKGYTVNGVWLGHENLQSFHWVRGEQTNDGQLRFGVARPIIQGPKDYQLRWKGYFGACGAAMKIGDKPHLILLGDLDRVLAMPFQVRDGVIHCEPAANLLANNGRLLQCYIASQVTVADIDGDRTPELVVSGNPGSVAVLHGREVGQFQERQVLTAGGALAMQTLIIPCLADWDGNGQADLIAGDASGWLMFWPGTGELKTFGRPEYFTIDGKPLHIQAGYAGSIQGPNEARWGYLNPTVCDWDNDGKPEIISCDINGDLFLWRRGASILELQPPTRFTMNGTPLPVAWRQRVAFAPGHDGLAGDDRPCLLIQDYDGDLALAVSQSKGTASIERLEKLKYQDGHTIRTCGPTGCWGRSKFVWMDWDGDGKKDVIYSTNRASNKFIIEEDVGKRSVPLFLKNVGTTNKPIFARPVPLKYKGEIFDFGTHISAVWPLQGTGAETGGIIVGGEDGRVYLFQRKEITP